LGPPSKLLIFELRMKGVVETLRSLVWLGSPGHMSFRNTYNAARLGQ